MPLLIIIVLTFISGCVPLWVEDYYSPAAIGGTLKQSECAGENYGPLNMIEFIKNNVKIQLKIFEEEKGIHVSFRLRIPKDNKARLVNNVIHVSTPSNPTVMEVLLNPHQFPGLQPYWKIDETLIGDTVEEFALFGSSYRYNSFIMTATVEMPKSDTIKIKLPELFINDQRIQLPEITFKKDRVLEFFVPLNC